MAERFTGTGFAGRPQINLSASGGTVAGATVLDGSNQINLVAGTNITLTGTDPSTITIESSGGGGGGGISGTIAAPQVAYATAADTIGGTAGFTFDSANTVLTLGSGGAISVSEMQMTTRSQTLVGSGAIDSWSAATYRSVKYTIQVDDTTTGDYQASEVLGLHDGTTAYVVEYASLFSSVPLGAFNATISGGNFVLDWTPSNPADSHTVKVIRSVLQV
jgi:hypothetical protein